jgi:hypothetical protein
MIPLVRRTWREKINSPESMGCWLQILNEIPRRYEHVSIVSLDGNGWMRRCSHWPMRQTSRSAMIVNVIQRESQQTSRVVFATRIKDAQWSAILAHQGPIGHKAWSRTFDSEHNRALRQKNSHPSDRRKCLWKVRFGRSQQWWFKSFKWLSLTLCWPSTIIGLKPV